MKALKWIACAAVLAGSMAATQKARADVMIAGDFDVGVPVDVRNTYVPLTVGAGFDARLGFRFHIPRTHVAITPELAAGYTNMNSTFIRVRPGVRLGFGRLIVPYLYGHIGWGWTSFDEPGSTVALSGRTATPVTNHAQGGAFDAGFGIDVTVVRHLTLGAHAGYNVISAGDPSKIDIVGSTPALDHPKWFNFGLNASVYF